MKIIQGRTSTSEGLLLLILILRPPIDGGCVTFHEQKWDHLWFNLPNGGKINTGLNDNITKFILINGDPKRQLHYKGYLKHVNGEFLKELKNSFC